MPNTLHLMLLTCLLTGCTGDFLDKKPQKSLLVPQGLADMQALLDNSINLMNVAPALPMVSDGDFIMSGPVLQSQSQMTQSSYVWSDQVQNELGDWDIPYKQVFYCNIVLDGLANMQSDGGTEHNSVKAGALFFRALAFYNLAQQFCAQYDPATASQLPGIPLGLKADINQILPRSSLTQTYGRIIEDLLQAEPLLETTALYLTRPSRPAVQALLARIYLSMGDYAKAGEYAQACLALKNDLLDYSTLKPASASPFPLPLVSANPEVLFYSRVNNTAFDNAGTTVDSSLLKTYKDNDLRKLLYFNSAANYKGSYTGTIYPFSGLSTSEVYLISAECQARDGQTAAAMSTLNKLLENRSVKSEFKQLTASSADEALSVILSERRKEMVGRAVRWQDLRRLNRQPAYAQELVRIVDGVTYRLAANGRRYLFKIPLDQIVGSGIEQNP